MKKRKQIPSPLRVLIVDDQPLARQGLHLVFYSLRKHLNVEIREAADSPEAIAQLQIQPFDLALVDFQLGEYFGDELTSNLLRIQPFLLVIGISAMDEAIIAKSYMEAGATAFLVKFFGPAELLQALRIIYLGNEHYTPEIEKYLLDWKGKKLLRKKKKSK